VKRRKTKTWPTLEFEKPVDLENWFGWYNEYLTSPLWRERRDCIMERANHRCEVCRKRAAYQIHHLTYARAGRELPDDLIAVCDRCHDDYHPDKR
jgi:5-methylcytosine-specific restriction endonuclease McrA